MRPLRLTSLALALAAALGGCSVDVEGAACRVAGSTADCPAGQACGTGLTCSVRAASCAPCAVGQKACKPGDKNVWECTADGDPACGSLKLAAVAACVAGTQTCQVPLAGGDPVCACVQHVVDPAGGTCTHASIFSAITAAVAFPSPVVVLGGASTLYGNAIDDAAPIVIPAGLTLIGDAASPAAATNRIIVLHGPGPEGLQVHPGAVVRGLAVERDDPTALIGAPPGAPRLAPTVGVLLTGGAASSGNTLVSVRVDASGVGGGFVTGLRVAGANAVAVGDVLVRGATGSGLEVNRLGATDVVVVSASTFDQNQVGVSLLRGDLSLQGAVVKRSGWEGVVAATGAPGQTSLAIQNGLISWNGRGGVRLSVNDGLSVTGTRVCKNTGYMQPLLTRTVGGIFVLGNPPATLTFKGNLIHDNGGDQVAVAGASGVWNLSGAALCAVSDRNVFANYAAPGVGIAAVDATVSALFNYWGNAVPILDTDFTAVSGAVDAGVLGNSFCLHVPVADFTCPAP